MKSPLIFKNLLLGKPLLKKIRKIKATFDKNTKITLSRLERLQIFYSDFFRANDLVFDVGANKGKLTEVFLELGAKVVAVDPNEECIQFLKEKFKGCKNLHVVQKALSSKEGREIINICQRNPDFEFEDPSVFSTLLDKEKITERFRNEKNQWLEKSVEVTTLDKLIQDYGMPQFCKIDVEGYEGNVLEGLSHPIRSLSFEYMAENHSNLSRCLSKLGEIGTYFFKLATGHSYSFTTSSWLSNNGLIQHLKDLNRNTPGLWGDIYAILNS